MDKETKEEVIRVQMALRQSFEFYAPRCLKIAVKKGGALAPFTLNKAQEYLHQRAEDMLKRKGYIRIIVLKGRQQGISTYISGRFYYKATGLSGVKIGILTHEQKATDNLFAMVRRYHDNCLVLLKQSTAADSAKELWFDKLDTRYQISTAGAKATGRSSTLQFFHGSEVAFWQSAADHMSGIGQALPLVDGSESFLESTADGVNNIFHAKWQDAVRGDSEYEAVFIPWFWEPGYSIEPPTDFVLDPEEAELRDTYDLTLGQMAWRRMKILGDFTGDIGLFNQEYPCSPEMAFMRGSKGSLISPVVVNAAAIPKPGIVKASGPLIIGVDPAEYGDDHTGIVVRHGRKVIEIQRVKMGPMELVGHVGMMIDRLDPDATCIDVGGSHGVADRLIELNYKNVYKINFGSSSMFPEQYVNKRIEIWDQMRLWLEDYPCEIKPHPVLIADLSAPKFTYDSSRRRVLESKEKMKSERGISSPDLGDALALTFAVAIRPKRDRMDEYRERLLKRNKTRNPMAA